MKGRESQTQKSLAVQDRERSETS